MKIGVMGTGVVGQTISEKFAQLKHKVMIGTRDVETLMNRKSKDNSGRPPFSEWINNNNEIKLGTFNEAAEFGEILFNCTNGNGSIAALKSIQEENLNGKILVDISNPLDFSKGMPPTLFVCNDDSLGEQIQRTFPSLKVVKTLNTLNAYLMINPGLLPDDHNIFLNGNVENAKKEVTELLISFGWKRENIIDMGDITTARGTEQLLPIWIRLMGIFKTPMFNFKIVK